MKLIVYQNSDKGDIQRANQIDSEDSGKAQMVEWLALQAVRFAEAVSANQQRSKNLWVEVWVMRFGLLV